MVKKAVKAEINAFIRGLITEASALNFPGDATIDEQNFVINRDGSRNRRLGLDLEPSYSLISTGTTLESIQTSPLNTYKWSAVNGNSSLNYLVVQVQDDLHIFDLANDTLSASPLAVVDMSTILLPADRKYSFTTVDGKLVVVGGVDTVGVVEYTGTTFTKQSLQISVRDVWGLQESTVSAYDTDDQYRGTSLPADHNYNLYNQSWAIPRKNSSGTLTDTVSMYYSGLNKYPSNSEMAWAGMDFQAVVGGTPFERFYPSLMEETFGLKIKAAKGHFIIDLLNRGSSRSSAVASNKANNPAAALATISPPEDHTPQGATSICQYSGRVFFAGFGKEVVGGDSKSPVLSNYIFFSQLVKNTPDIVKCYQEGDPTSRDESDIVDSDGGYIRIGEMDTVLGMTVIGNSLIIFASNGVWSVTGGNDYGFSATNYRVDKITNYSCTAFSSVVNDGAMILYWSLDGIYALAPAQIGGHQVKNLTETTIQTLYEEISLTSKENTVGVLDVTGRKIRWFYYEGTPFESDYEMYELVLDSVLSAFCKNRIYNSVSNTVAIGSVFSSNPFTPTLSDSDVYVSNDQVLVGTDAVTVTTVSRNTSLLDTRYLCIVLDSNVPKITFGYYKNVKFLDWESLDDVGVDAYAYMTTGEVVAGDSSSNKQIPVLHMHFKRTEYGVGADYIPDNQSSCLVRTQWDFANSSNSNRWTSSFQAYRPRAPYLVDSFDDPYDTGFAVVTTRNKIRGKGKAFAFHMETEAGKDCHILGWTFSMNGNSIA